MNYFSVCVSILFLILYHINYFFQINLKNIYKFKVKNIENEFFSLRAMKWYVIYQFFLAFLATERSPYKTEYIFWKSSSRAFDWWVIRPIYSRENGLFYFLPLIFIIIICLHKILENSREFSRIRENSLKKSKHSHEFARILAN